MKSSLHIGLNEVHPPAYNGWPGWLNGPTFDCALLAPLLARAGFEAVPRINDAASLLGVSGAILQMAEAAHRGDWVFIQDSSHGTRVDRGIFGGYSEAICLHDGLLTDVEFRKLLAHFRPGVRVLVVLDCCHSGGMDRTMDDYRRPRVCPAHLHPPTLALERGDAPVVADVIVATACQANEVCVEDWVPAHKRVAGAFTLALAETFSPTATVGAWLDRARQFALEQYPAQHPRVLHVGGNADNVLKQTLA